LSIIFSCSHENVGHFGLAATYYTHFTSPIRRYPDLIVHRTLANLLTKKKSSSTSPAIDLQQAGDFLSGRERVAVLADREMTDRLKVRFMAGKIGEAFDGIISGVSLTKKATGSSARVQLKFFRLATLCGCGLKV
jgi:ribonuclease R